ncbi:protein translocase subunit SecF, partial [Candidatus Parcubacteria bacterium]|nr:protein translocase subunit SecF [Candidatus Parcubacteria bacterium]
MNIIKHSKTYFTISGILAGISILSMLFWGLNFGIDFTGGSMLEVEFTSERLANEEVKDRLSDLELGN